MSSQSLFTFFLPPSHRHAYILVLANISPLEQHGFPQRSTLPQAGPQHTTYPFIDFRTFLRFSLSSCLVPFVSLSLLYPVRFCFLPIPVASFALVALCSKSDESRSWPSFPSPNPVLPLSPPRRRRFSSRANQSCIGQRSPQRFDDDCAAS